jgi:hypothetical protein
MPISPRRHTVEQLRSAVDSGRTGDKVAWPDPAAAPLGSDDEAAGTPVSRAAVAMAQQAERSGPVETPQARSGLGHAWILVAVIILVAALFIGLGVAGR